MYAGYMATYGTIYPSKEEYEGHFEAFRATLRRLEQHKLKMTAVREESNGTNGHTTFGLNEMSDWSEHDRKMISGHFNAKNFSRKQHI